MPRGLNRTNLNTTGTSYRKGTPVSLPHAFGTAITLPHEFGNPAPASFGNPMTLPHNFGNDLGASSGTAGFSLEDGSGVILLESGGRLLLEVQ